MPDSRNHKPPKPVGSGPFITYCQWVWDELSRRYEDTETVKWNITTRGISARAANLRKSGIELPFQIYQTTTWLKFKVTTGYVITTGVAVTPALVETEFTITSGVLRYWFYLDLTAAATVAASSTLPTWGIDIIPIGWVDTSTYSAESRSVIYQFTRDHVFSPCVV